MAKRTKDELLFEAKEQIQESSPAEAHAALKGGAVLLDVREADEVAAGSIEGATWIPRGRLELKIESVFDERDQEIHILCAGGNRSALAALSLQRMGYSKVSSVRGGFGAWKEDNLPWEVPADSLSDAQRARYSRHLLLSEVGESGQRAMLEGRVLLVGAGGLGSPVAYYLAAAGVGTIGVVDPDVVDGSNLQRQILHRSCDIGVLKVESAARAIRELNPDVQVEPIAERLGPDNVDRIFDAGWDVVVDGCDNFSTRYLINDACAARGIPNVHGSIYRFEGQVSVFHPANGGPCYRCLYPEPPPPSMVPNCAEAGVIGVLPGVVGTLQATETIKLLLGTGEPLTGRLLQWDSLAMEWNELKFSRAPDCPVHGS